MKDLISRQAVIDELREAENHAFNSFYKGLVKAHKIIANIPSAQTEPSQVARDIATIIENEQDMRVMLSQPEIVRCKDCKHWINDHLCESLSRFGSFETKADFYCGYSERRTDECTD